jgi:uncharacterized glyoxalase superfamily protein PhnB
MVSSEKEKFPLRSEPGDVGGANTQNMMVYVDDADAHCEHAQAAGAKIVSEPSTTDDGSEWWTDRGYEVQDLGGHHWWFYQRLGERGGQA